LDFQYDVKITKLSRTKKPALEAGFAKDAKIAALPVQFSNLFIHDLRRLVDLLV
jgi:hypothetical protein